MNVIETYDTDLSFFEIRKTEYNPQCLAHFKLDAYNISCDSMLIYDNSGTRDEKVIFSL